MLQVHGKGNAICAEDPAFADSFGENKTRASAEEKKISHGYVRISSRAEWRVQCVLASCDGQHASARVVEGDFLLEETFRFLFTWFSSILVRHTCMHACPLRQGSSYSDR